MGPLIKHDERNTICSNFNSFQVQLDKKKNSGDTKLSKTNKSLQHLSMQRRVRTSLPQCSVTDSDRQSATVLRQEEEQEAGPVTDWPAVQQPVASAAVRWQEGAVTLVQPGGGQRCGSERPGRHFQTSAARQPGWCRWCERVRVSFKAGPLP